MSERDDRSAVIAVDVISEEVQKIADVLRTR